MTKASLLAMPLGTLPALQEIAKIHMIEATTYRQISEEGPWLIRGLSYKLMQLCILRDQAQLFTNYHQQVCEQVRLSESRELGARLSEYQSSFKSINTILVKSRNFQSLAFHLKDNPSLDSYVLALPPLLTANNLRRTHLHPIQELYQLSHAAGRCLEVILEQLCAKVKVIDRGVVTLHCPKVEKIQLSVCIVRVQGKTLLIDNAYSGIKKNKQSRVQKSFAQGCQISAKKQFPEETARPPKKTRRYQIVNNNVKPQQPQRKNLLLQLKLQDDINGSVQSPKQLSMASEMAMKRSPLNFDSKTQLQYKGGKKQSWKNINIKAQLQLISSKALKAESNSRIQSSTRRSALQEPSDKLQTSKELDKKLDSSTYLNTQPSSNQVYYKSDLSKFYNRKANAALDSPKIQEKSENETLTPSPNPKQDKTHPQFNLKNILMRNKSPPSSHLTEFKQQQNQLQRQTQPVSAGQPKESMVTKAYKSIQSNKDQKPQELVQPSISAYQARQGPSILSGFQAKDKFQSKYLPVTSLPKQSNSYPSDSKYLPVTSLPKQSNSYPPDSKYLPVNSLPKQSYTYPSDSKYMPVTSLSKQSSSNISSFAQTKMPKMQTSIECSSPPAESNNISKTSSISSPLNQTTSGYNKYYKKYQPVKHQTAQNNQNSFRNSVQAKELIRSISPNPSTLTDTTAVSQQPAICKICNKPIKSNRRFCQTCTTTERKQCKICKKKNIPFFKQVTVCINCQASNKMKQKQLSKQQVKPVDWKSYLTNKPAQTPNQAKQQHSLVQKSLQEIKQKIEKVKNEPKEKDKQKEKQEQISQGRQTFDQRYAFNRTELDNKRYQRLNTKISQDKKLAKTYQYPDRKDATAFQNRLGKTQISANPSKKDDPYRTNLGDRITEQKKNQLINQLVTKDNQLNSKECKFNKRRFDLQNQLDQVHSKYSSPKNVDYHAQTKDDYQKNQSLRLKRQMPITEQRQFGSRQQQRKVSNNQRTGEVTKRFIRQDFNNENQEILEDSFRNASFRNSIQQAERYERKRSGQRINNLQKDWRDSQARKQDKFQQTKRIQFRKDAWKDFKHSDISKEDFRADEKGRNYYRQDFKRNHRDQFRKDYRNYSQQYRQEYREDFSQSQRQRQNFKKESREIYRNDSHQFKDSRQHRLDSYRTDSRQNYRTDSRQNLRKDIYRPYAQDPRKNEFKADDHKLLRKDQKLGYHRQEYRKQDYRWKKRDQRSRQDSYSKQHPMDRDSISRRDVRKQDDLYDHRYQPVYAKGLYKETSRCFSQQNRNAQRKKQYDNYYMSNSKKKGNLAQPSFRGNQGRRQSEQRKVPRSAYDGHMNQYFQRQQVRRMGSPHKQEQSSNRRLAYNQEDSIKKFRPNSVYFGPDRNDSKLYRITSQRALESRRGNSPPTFPDRRR